MAKYAPFAEKTGMKKIAEQQKIETVSEVSKILLKLGFDLQLLGSERYIMGKLESLSPKKKQTKRSLYQKQTSAIQKRVLSEPA